MWLYPTKLVKKKYRTWKNLNIIKGTDENCGVSEALSFCEPRRCSVIRLYIIR